MASSIWSGYLTFGLISIPVKLFPAARSEGVGFNMLHRECGSRVKQQLWCPQHERVVTRDEIVKGYEYEKDRYVTLEPAEIKQIEPKTARAMEILEFVPLDQVDPVYFETSYYLMPDEPGLRAYALLKTAMEQSKYLALARVSMHNREYTVLLRPHGEGIMIHSMFYENEVRRMKDIAPLEMPEVKEKELALAHSLIESLAGTFEPAKYHDAFAEQLKKLVEAKVEGQPIVETEKPKLAPVIDLMAALKKSLAEARKAPGKAAVARAAAEAEEEAEAAPAGTAARARRRPAQNRHSG